MTPLERARLNKALNDNGYHVERPLVGDWLPADATFADGRCFVRFVEPDAFFVATSLPHVAEALRREGCDDVRALLPEGAAAAFSASGDAGLHGLVRRIYQLTRSLPTAPWDAFLAQTRGLPTTTEAERLVVQRIGQSIFRERLLDYWGGACAVTAMDQPELLRASHIKPWAACESTPSERLDANNGLLLCADLDAALDAGLIAFDPDGGVILASALTPRARARIAGLWIKRRSLLTAQHQPYLDWHRRNVFRGK